MAGKLVATTPVPSKQTDDVVPRRVKHQHRGIGAFVFQQGGQRPHSYACCANKDMGGKAGVSLGQQGANFVKGCAFSGAKARRGKELHAGNFVGAVLWQVLQRLPRQIPRAGSKAGCQTLRQWQGRLAERVTGKRVGAVRAGQGASGFRLNGSPQSARAGWRILQTGRRGGNAGKNPRTGISKKPEGASMQPPLVCRF